jgi:hypothetical protein
MEGHRALDSFPVFAPRPPWLSGDLQTLRNFVRRTWYDLSPWPETRLDLAMADGDRLLGQLHAPEQARATVVLIHGLTGCADSTYVRATARHLLSSGYAVLRLNLRGAGPARPLCRLQYHAGRTDDLRQALNVFAARRPDLAGALFAIGYSLGGNMLLKYLGEEGRATPLRAAVAVSAPIDLSAASQRLMMPRNRVYHSYLIGRMRAEALAPSADLSAEERRAILAARTVYEYDDRFVAPRNGFADAADYYRRSSAVQHLGGIATPTLIIHARDDPWIPAESYRAVDWRGLPTLTPLLPPHGGHVGFHGVGSRVPWHDRCAAVFLDRALLSIG